jgi:hypothetical protein
MLARLRPLVLAALPALALVGCSSSGRSELQLSSQRDGGRFTQSFPVGVADVQDAGDTDVVVNCQTAAATPDAPPVRQVLHVRVLWQQGYRLKPSMHEVSTNAAFHWYVYPAGATDAAGRAQVVEYTGVGLVELTRDGDQVTVTVAGATITPTTVTDRMNDPLGPTTLAGTIVARKGRRETTAQLGDLRATVAATKQPSRVVEAKLSLGQ